jgi:hypothetical protein
VLQRSHSRTQWRSLKPRGMPPYSHKQQPTRDETRTHRAHAGVQFKNLAQAGVIGVVMNPNFVTQAGTLVPALADTIAGVGREHPGHCTLEVTRQVPLSSNGAALRPIKCAVHKANVRAHLAKEGSIQGTLTGPGGARAEQGFGVLLIN